MQHRYKAGNKNIRQNISSKDDFVLASFQGEAPVYVTKAKIPEGLLATKSPQNEKK